jgi:phosphopantothenoylcysteine decarboxylase / phosphopantothenate---cysteine ligase
MSKVTAGDRSDRSGGQQRVLLCVTGGIAAYKSVYVVRELSQMGADVRVVMTDAARHFVGEQTFAALSGNPVATDVWGAGGGEPGVPHVELARGADVAIVAPATANAIAKLALGLADDLFSATMLTVTCPVVLAPAMHAEMWMHPATAAHVATLVERGVALVGPAEGALSSGDTGPGRMAEPEEIVRAALAALGQSQHLAGRRVLVTAGGTQEPIDPVRFIGNRSSGRMGFAIAGEAERRGAKVTLVAGPTTLSPPSGVEIVYVRTAEEMRDAVFAVAPECDVIVKAAAVADFRPSKRADHKLKKAAGSPEIDLLPTHDILAELGKAREKRKPGGVLAGFAAETEPDPAGLAQLAEEKRRAKGADLIVANDVGSSDSGFEGPTNRAVIVGPSGVRDVGLVTKEALAVALWDEIVALLEG